MKPKKAMVERIATITPIATRNTPFTISLMMPQRMPNTPKAVRIIKPHIANPMYCATCLKFAVAVISSLFLIFLFFMRIQELRELSFKLSYLPLVYPTFFLCVFLSHRSFSFRVLEKVGIRECKVFREKYYPQGWRFFLKTIEHPNPGFTFAPRTGTIHLMRLSERPSKWR
jgi:hypothetical protein